MSTTHASNARLRNANLSKSAVQQLILAYRVDENAAVVPDFKFREGFIYTQTRAISNRVNQNFDSWPSLELKKSFKTFLGKPVFVNHANHDPKLARGRVVAARYVESDGKDNYIDVIQEVDARRFPKLAKELIEGGLDSVSMGVEALRTICSYCKHEAVTESDFCDHVKHHKGEYLPRVASNGEEESVLVYESCVTPETQVLVEGNVTRPIKEISAGDRVIDHTGRARLVTNTTSRLVSEDLLHISWAGNYFNTLKLTGNHPVFAIRSKDTEYPSGGLNKERVVGLLDRGTLSPEFISSSELQEGDWVCEVAPQEHGFLTKIRTLDYTDTPDDKSWYEEEHVPSTEGDELFYPEWAVRKTKTWTRRKCHAPNCSSVMELRPSELDRMYCSSKCYGTWRCGKNIANRNGNGSRHRIPDTLELTYDLGLFIGWFLAEGSLSSSSVHFSLHLDETEQAKDIARLSRELFGATSIRIHQPNPNSKCQEVVVQGAPLARFMKNFGWYSRERALPEEFMSAPLEFLEGVATGHELGDGLHGNEYSPTSQRREHLAQYVHVVTTVSPKLAEQLYTIHLMLGRTPTRSKPEVSTIDGRETGQYHHCVSWKNLLHHGPKTRLGTKGRLLWGPWSFARIRKIDKVPYSGTVHNLEVEGSHSYTAEGVAVHNCKDLHFFELSYVFDPADETAVVSKVLVANKQRKQSYGETEAPARVDTLREEEISESDNDFHHYVSPPKEFQDPDLDEALRVDRKDFSEDVVVEPTTLEDIELIETLKALEEESHARGLDDGLSADFGEEDVNNNNIDDALEQVTLKEDRFEEEDDVVHLSNKRQSVQHNRIRGGRSGRLHRMSVEVDEFPGEEFAPASEESFEEVFGNEDSEDDEEVLVDPEDLSDQELIEALDALEEEGMERGIIYTDSSVEDELPYGDSDLIDEDSTEKMSKKSQQRRKNMGRSSLAERGRVAARGQRQHKTRQAGGPLADSGDLSRNDQGDAEDTFISQTPPEEGVETGGGQPISNTEQNLVAKLVTIAKYHPNSQIRRQAARKLAGRRQAMVRHKLVTIAKHHPNSQIRRQAATILQRQQSRVSKRNQLITIARSHPNPRIRQQAVRVLSENPTGGHSLDTAVGDVTNPYTGGSMQPEDWVAQPGGGGNTWQKPASRRRSTNEGTIVNPPLSGTDEQGLRGDSFDDVALDNIETQPRDASKRAFAHFDAWLQRATGRTASQHTHIGELRRYAQQWSRQSRSPIASLFPTLETVLRQARVRKANESLDVAAPDGRIDVEAPVANDTDAEAQASQYDIHDYGNNAGDGIADPDLSNDQIWAPGEKTSRVAPRADQILAMRCADAYAKCNLVDSENERYNLASNLSKMSRATVSSQLRLLERVAEVIQEKDDQISNLSRRTASRGSTHGATALPPGIGSMQRAASVEKFAANDPVNDMAMWVNG